MGAKNRLIWFDDETYLEVVAFTELNDFTAPFLAVLEEHEGAKFYGTDVVDAYLGGRGALVRYHNNTLALLEPDGPGPVADFTADRGEGIMGVSIQVADLEAALALVNDNTGLDLESFQYKGRDRFLIPAPLTHEFLIELVESQ